MKNKSTRQTINEQLVKDKQSIMDMIKFLVNNNIEFPNEIGEHQRNEVEVKKYMSIIQSSNLQESFFEFKERREMQGKEIDLIESQVNLISQLVDSNCKLNKMFIDATLRKLDSYDLD